MNFILFLFFKKKTIHLPHSNFQSKKINFFWFWILIETTVNLKSNLMDQPSPHLPSPKHPILVYVPGCCVARININLKSKISELRFFVPSQSSITFLFNGQILLENFSFEFYGIKPLDIVVIVQQSQQDDSTKWISLTKDNDSFTDRISSIINQKTSREAARLRDFQLIRMERKPKTFRKLCSAKMTRMSNSNSYNIYNLYQDTNSIKTNIDYKKSDSPNTEELPSFWGNNYCSKSDPNLSNRTNEKNLNYNQESDESSFNKIRSERINRSITP